MSWDDLRVLLAAERAGSLGRAAVDLGVSTSTVSRRIQALEQELGRPLIARTPEGVSLTPAGAVVAAHATGMDQHARALDQALASLGTTPRGRVRVAAPGDMTKVVLVPALRTLLDAYPEVELVLLESVPVVDLWRREAEIAVRTFLPSVGVDDLVVKRVRGVRFGLCAAASYLDTLPDPTDPSQWRWVRTVQVESPLVAYERSLAEGRPTLWASQQATTRAAVAAGGGVALLPMSIALTTPGIVEIPAPTPPPSFPLWLVCHRAVRSAPHVSVVWDFLDEVLSGEGSEAHDIQVLRDRATAAWGWTYPSEGRTTPNHSVAKVRPVRRDT